MPNRFVVVSTIVVVALLMAGCATDQSTWLSAREQDTKAAYQSYLEQYPAGDFAQDARDQIEQIDYQEAESQHTIASYKHFLSLYPKGKLTVKARSGIEGILFNEARQKDTLEAYDQFLRQYTDGGYSTQARTLRKERARFEEVCQQGTVEAYQAFLQRSPESRFSDEARAHIEKLRHKHIGTARHIRLITGDIDGTASGAGDLLSETVKSIFSEGGLTPTKEDSATLVLVPSLSKGSSFVRYGKTVNDSTFGNEYAFTIRLIAKSEEVLCERVYKGEVKAKARAKRADFPAVEIQGLDIEELGPKLRAHLRDFYDRYVAPARRVRSDK